jgi:hypothetical protein
MKLKCPVALCGWEGKSHQFHKHIEDYKIEWKGVMDSGFPRAESHERWANYFFSKIWTSDLPEKVRWTNIAFAYVESMKVKAKPKGKGKLSPDGSDKIEMHDGKITMNGQEHTPEEFSRIMPGIKVPSSKNPPFETVKDISGQLRITQNGKEYTIDEFRKIQREKLEMLKK